MHGVFARIAISVANLNEETMSNAIIAYSPMNENSQRRFEVVDERTQTKMQETHSRSVKKGKEGHDILPNPHNVKKRGSTKMVSSNCYPFSHLRRMQQKERQRGEKLRQKQLNKKEQKATKSEYYQTHATKIKRSGICFYVLANVNT